MQRDLFFLILLLAVCEARATPQSQPSAADFCQSVRALVQASYSDFGGIKRNVTRNPDGSTDWVPSIAVAGASDCEGQSDPTISSSVSCTGAKTQSLGELEPIYQSAVHQVRSCLDPSFVFQESQGGKSSRLRTPIKEASFEVKSKDGPDGPGVRITLFQWHGRSTDYEIEIWIDAKGKD